MNDELISGYVYVEFDDIQGTLPIIWEPGAISEEIRMLVGIKAISLLTGEQGYIPHKLVVLPFPSRNLKGILKFIQWEDESRRGGIGKSVVVFLFDEIHDLIFYKYSAYLESAFEEAAEDLKLWELSDPSHQYVPEVLGKLRQKVISILEKLKLREEYRSSTGEFPEKSIKQEDVDFKFKLVVCGDPGVGKTSAILRFTDNAFTANYIPTLGVNISEKILNLDENLVFLLIWDIAGQIKFMHLRKHFYQGAEAILLIFDLTKQGSLDSIDKWYQDIKKNLENKEDLIGFLVGNKKDLIDERRINEDNARELAEKLSLRYIEVSALTGENINYVFRAIAQNVYDSILSDM